jgi:hypothetical protein
MSNRKFAPTALACLLLSGAALAQTADVISPAPFATHYIATRPDLRKCAFPACGGFYVKAVNRALTRCADGSLQKECHVATLNTQALPWSEAERAAFEKKAFIPGQGLALGKLVALKGGTGSLKTDTLVITEGWVGQAGSKPTGVFYQLKNSGIVCITTPCPSITETTLNYPISQNIHGVDLAASGAKPAQVDAGLQALGSTGVLAAGGHKAITGPAGQGLQFIASQFYLPFATAKTR